MPEMVFIIQLLKVVSKILNLGGGGAVGQKVEEGLVPRDGPTRSAKAEGS